jgi:tRNA G26 N,N-dimethylase Trm1
LKLRYPDIEKSVNSLDKRVEELKIHFNLFFSGELNIPPEKERSDIERQIRNVSNVEQKSAKINLLIQNVASKFALYNNMWLKKLHEIEVGLISTKKKASNNVGEKQDKKIDKKSITVSLNDEDSFEKFFKDYHSLSKKQSIKSSDKETIINSLKSKMITANLVDAKINLTRKQGKVKIRIMK